MSRISESQPRRPSHLAADAPVKAPAKKDGVISSARRWVKVEFVDRAEARAPKEGAKRYSPVQRQYGDVVWRDTGAPVSLRDRKVAQMLTDKVRPRGHIAAKAADKNASAISVKGDMLIPESTLKIARDIYDKKGADGIPHLLARAMPRPTLADLLTQTEDIAFRKTVEGEMERAAVPATVHDDLAQALSFLETSRKDIARMGALAAKMEEGGKISDKEYGEFAALLYSYKENFPLALNYLMQIGERGDLTAEQRAVLDAVQTRVADTHMALADLMTLHSEHLPDEPPLTRADRIESERLEVDAMRGALKLFKEARPDDPALQSVCDEMEARLAEHREAIGRVEAGGSTEDLELALAAPLLKKQKPTKSDLDALEARLNERWATQAPPLPPHHPRMTRKRMLAFYVNAELKRAGIERRGLPPLSFAIERGRARAMEERAWPKIDHEIELDIGGKVKKYRSVIEPASHLSKRLREDYDGNGVVSADRMAYKHAVNLARTELRDEEGKLLYAAHRMGVIDPYDITPKNLANLPRAELREMIQTLLVDTGASRESAADIFQRFQGSASERRRISSLLRQEAAKHQARDLAATILLSSPEKLESALKGEVVDLPITSLSLMTPDYLRHAGGAIGAFKRSSDERAMLRTHRAALESLANNGQPITLQIRDRYGNRRQNIQLRVRPRVMSFGVNAGALRSYNKLPSNREPFFRRLMGWGFSARQNDPVLTEMLGKRGDLLLKGEVAREITRSRDRAAELASQLGSIEISHQDRGRVTKEMEAEANRAQRLHQLGVQVKQMWRSQSYLREGHEPYKMVSRLAALLHAMGEETVVHCKSGKDRTGAQDSEVKYLMAMADARGGSVPELDRAPDSDSRRIRTAFNLRSGSREIQRYNTGLPGYKTEGVPSLMKLMERSAVPVYRGGSAFVHS